MAQEDLKHLFPDEEFQKEDSLELVGELSFNVDETTAAIKKPMEFNNLPSEPQKLQLVKNESTDLLMEILDKIDSLESKVVGTDNEYKKTVVHKSKILDQRISHILQKLLTAHPIEKHSILTIKKLLNDFLKTIS